MKNIDKQKLINLLESNKMSPDVNNDFVDFLIERINSGTLDADDTTK